MQQGQITTALARDHHRAKTSVEKDNALSDWKADQEKHLKLLQREGAVYNDFWKIVKCKIVKLLF